MATLARQAAPVWRWPAVGGAAAPALLAAAVLLRLPHFGDPAFMIDEQFYLVAGDRLLHGAWPFVDVWDRKPIGLFAIYAVAAAFGPAATLAYQVMATVAAAATAWVVARIARPMAGAVGAAFAGLLYLLWIEIAEGGGGQSPIFYNLPVALAALFVLRAGNAPAGGFARPAYAAMALIGVAIQIKYTVLFEGLFLGLVLAVWTLARTPLPAAMSRIVGLAAVAMAPTTLVFLAYAAAGHGGDFVFANFRSIFLRAPTPPEELAYRSEMVALRLLPFVLCIAAGLWHLRGRSDGAARRWRLVLLGWCAASLAGICSVGTLYSHYILPAFVPFAAAAAPIFRRRPSGPVLAILTALLPAATLDWPDFARTERHVREIAAITALIPDDVDRRCLLLFDGPPILYRTTKACTLTRYTFPDHLSAALEAQAIGVDPAAELGRILARRPRAIVLAEGDVRAPNHATFALLRRTLARDYRLAGSPPFDGRPIGVWVSR